MGSKIKTVLTVMFGAAVVALAVLMVLSNNKHEQEIANYEAEMMELQDQLNSLGDLQQVYLAAANLTPGQEIKETDLTTMDVPESMTVGLVTNLDDILGHFYRIEIPQGTPIAECMTIETQIESSSRYLDVITDYNAIGLAVGDYVDIRVSLPYGEDMIAMSHKRVVEINSNILKLEVNEWDIQVYASLTEDRLMYPGTNIYAIQYVSAGTQEAAQTFYVPSVNILTSVKLNPNYELGWSEEEWNAKIAERQLIETSLQQGLDEEIGKTIEQGKASINSSMAGAVAARQKADEAAAKAAAKGESRSSGGAIRDENGNRVSQSFE